MTTAQDDIDWLTRSENRVQALELLNERSYDRSELLEAVDVSRVTFNRMLEGLDERGWIAQDNERKFHATPLGRIVIRDVLTAFNSAVTARKLRDLIEYLPTEEFDFDLNRLQNARITRPTETDTIAPLNRSAELLNEATQRFTPVVANVDRLHTGGVNEVNLEHAEAILTAEVMETILADSVMREDVIAATDTGFDLYLYDGSAPITINLFDDVVGLELNDGSGFVPAFIETDDQVVHDWAERTYEQYKGEAKPLDAEDFRT